MQTNNTADVDMTAFAAEAAAVSNVNPVAEAGVDAPAATNESGQKFYTEDDLAKVRAQEKDKLYPQIEQLKEELNSIKREKAERDANKAAKEAAREAEQAELARRKQEEELEVRDLLKLKEQEWQEQLERERQERERAFALLDREKAFAEIQAYKNQRLEDERDNIIPELIDMIHGNTAEEIEASIQGLKDKSSRIIESAQSAMQTARREMSGTRVTTPPAGPMDINTGSRQFTASEIADMPMDEYIKYRQQFLSPRAQGRSQGMFGQI